jgi:iron uptake system EfeUOB component EfeO/EfeM
MKKSRWRSGTRKSCSQLATDVTRLPQTRDNNFAFEMKKILNGCVKLAVEPLTSP